MFRCDLSGFVFEVLNILLLCFSAPLPSSILMLAKYIIVTPFLIIYKPYFSVTLAKSNAKALLTLTHHKCPCDLRCFEKSVSIASIITQRLKYRHIDAPILLSIMILPVVYAPISERVVARLPFAAYAYAFTSEFRVLWVLRILARRAYAHVNGAKPFFVTHLRVRHLKPPLVIQTSTAS